ncbi:hypothetical protein WICMUC_001039 [Wickerhamomyces mucosus]|uniref:Uncharacterized protein n=1 Tax=Wickerhamomyces mucosus TaxID=1378264 RepID=A0A9P8PW15_9ASCO|nr:hypothetical protein WICMUC_001039 [Wickerhamomyces mucosus]
MYKLIHVAPADAAIENNDAPRLVVETFETEEEAGDTVQSNNWLFENNGESLEGIGNRISDAFNEYKEEIRANSRIFGDRKEIKMVHTQRNDFPIIPVCFSQINFTNEISWYIITITVHNRNLIIIIGNETELMENKLLSCKLINKSFEQVTQFNRRELLHENSRSFKFHTIAQLTTTEFVFETIAGQTLNQDRNNIVQDNDSIKELLPKKKAILSLLSEVEIFRTYFEDLKIYTKNDHSLNQRLEININRLSRNQS